MAPVLVFLFFVDLRFVRWLALAVICCLVLSVAPNKAGQGCCFAGLLLAFFPSLVLDDRCNGTGAVADDSDANGVFLCFLLFASDPLPVLAGSIVMERSSYCHCCSAFLVVLLFVLFLENTMLNGDDVCGAVSCRVVSGRVVS